MIRRLIEREHAYAAEGDVYFDVHSYPEYGEFSGQRLDQMRPADDSSGAGKRDPRDFALWKAARPGEPYWETPWGPGRPAGTSSARPWPANTWAIASTFTAAAWIWCSRTTKTRSRNPIPPDTTSLITGCTTDWLAYRGEKMSKSLGNSLSIGQMLTQVRPAELRYYLGAGTLPLGA